jgi:hypothetical protein
MTPERWQQIKGVFDQAIACEPDQRVIFVRQVCATDEDLYREVVSLLGSYATTNSFFEKPIVAQRPAGDPMIAAGRHPGRGNRAARAGRQAAVL